MKRTWLNAVFVILIVTGIATGVWLDPNHQRSSEAWNESPVLAQPIFAAAAEPHFVGREVCRECHAENHQLHSQHGHATTFRRADDPEVVSKFVGKSFDAGEPYGTYTYHADDQGLFVRLSEKYGDQSFRLQYALGHHALTLMTLIPDPAQGTVGLEHRVSWFGTIGELDKTPGQRNDPPQTMGEMFGNKHQGFVLEKCIDCHVTTGEIVDQQIVDLVPNVNCEKCHGPASEHVKQARQMPDPPPFSVGRVDWDVESEIQLCGDCHRLPKDVSREQLREYPTSLARFQPVGMLRSECYLQSDGELKCTTCHNPHQSIEATTTTDHEQNCVKCHLPDSASHVACPVSPQTGCIDCHMPALKIEGLHTPFHDHWIRVREPQ
ncbi:cytochrome C [Stieleria sp. TO1_6]|uniref:multiheme c-type cytochrome n=1 Tax=Stieleria tagensis TaxID=2956795 RepID=UPI00209AF6EA|nr:multiheme c-type cytochrome [Stieleria tagensis]MCO8122295.1 cytochrome C [Stieleria tagensis]